MTDALTIRQDGTRVMLVYQGRCLCSMPWQAALDLAHAIRIQAKRAEELDRAPAIIHDQAIVTRLGLRFGLTSHPALLREACRQAAWDRNLRRYIPSGKARGLDRQSVVGAPSLIQTPPSRNKEAL
jgi:hypothetical protein